MTLVVIITQMADIRQYGAMCLIFPKISLDPVHPCIFHFVYCCIFKMLFLVTQAEELVKYIESSS